MAVKESARIAQSQLATMPERVAVVETKVDSMIVCIDQIKTDVKDMHDCLDQTRDLLAAKLEKMQDEYRINSVKFFEHTDKLHAEDVATDKKLADKIEDLEQFKTKWIYLTAGALAALGWISGHSTAVLALFK
jgi:hypothetical protein